jgi:hypothetical protein
VVDPQQEADTHEITHVLSQFREKSDRRRQRQDMKAASDSNGERERENELVRDINEWIQRLIMITHQCKIYCVC